MSNQQWDTRCPHCGVVSTETADGLKARHMQAVVKAVGGDAGRMREITENFEIECARCGKLSSFEPFSFYRRRKLEAVSKRFTALADLEKNPDKPWEDRVMGADEKKAMDLMCRMAGSIYQALEAGFPLELIKANSAKLIAVMEVEVASMWPGGKGAEPMRLLREMAAIAQADVGERADLVDVSAAQMEEKDAGIRAVLARAQQGQGGTGNAGRPGTKPAVAGAAQKSKCFIATAACGTPDDPLVEILRRFRDGTLLRHRAGRVLILLYERFSPPVAEWIDARPFARDLVRLCVVRPAAFCVRAVSGRAGTRVPTGR